MFNAIAIDSDEEGLYSQPPRRGICYAFEKGECERGDSCRFVHLPPNGGGGRGGGRGRGDLVGGRRSSERNSDYTHSSNQMTAANYVNSIYYNSYYQNGEHHLNSVNQIGAADEHQENVAVYNNSVNQIGEQNENAAGYNNPVTQIVEHHVNSVNQIGAADEHHENAAVDRNSANQIANDYPNVINKTVTAETCKFC